MERKLSVVFTVSSRSWGGNEKWAAEAARGLALRGHRVLVLWSHRPVADGLRLCGVPGRRVRLWGDLNPVGLLALVRAFREARADAVVLTKQRDHWMGGLVARLAGRPLVVFRLGLRRPLQDDLKRRLTFGRFADRVVVNSSAIRETLLESPWVDPATIDVLLNGVSIEPIREGAGREILDSLGIPPGCPVVCGAGRLTRQKGFDVLIRAFSGVLASHPDAVLLILGEGGRRDSLRETAEAAGVGGRVIFAGHRDDVRTILSAVDVYALASRNEGMANTLLEAMSVGAPIVATDVSGTLEAVRHDREALVVPPDRVRELSEAIVTLLGDREKAGRLGSAAIERAREKFGYDRMAAELERIIVRGLDERGEASGQRES